MDKNQRIKKRIIIIGVYCFILFFVLGTLYWIFKTKETCFDGIKNQDETEIDCGGSMCQICRPEEVIAETLAIEKAFFLKSDKLDNIETLALIKNSNADFGSGSFSYRFDLKNSKGEVIASRSGKSFILPGENKYLVENDIAVSEYPSEVKLEIFDVSWTKSNDLYEKPQLKIVNKRYDETKNGVIFGEAVGVLRNDSPFDFSLINVRVILFDSNDMILAVNSTEMRTVKSGEEREFRVIWPNKFLGSESVSRMEVQSEVNVFDSQIFFERYFETQKFQENF